jgi:hypothetical protein
LRDRDPDLPPAGSSKDLETPNDDYFQLVSDEPIYNYHNKLGFTVDAPERNSFKINGGEFSIFMTMNYAQYADDKRKPASQCRPRDCCCS